MVEVIFLQKFFVALALGLLIGLEREYARYKKRTHDYAGIRTFPLIALFGALAAFLGEVINVWLLVVASILMGLLIVVAYSAINNKKTLHMGATSEVAGLLTFFLGVLVYYGEVNLAVVLAIIVTTILYLRSLLHKLAKKITAEEFRDTLIFAVIAFVILPFLPNQGYGPLEIFNPYLVWLMVVFISGISFAGYILMRWFGERGIALAGILGGLVSSTAVTTSFAQRSSRQKKIQLALVLGVILANALMFVRIFVEVFVLNKDLLSLLLLPLSILLFISLIFSYFLWQKASKIKGKIILKSPFTLMPALKFGAIFALVLALVKIADVYLSTKGVYIVSLLSGIADVDAITVSLSQLARDSLTLEVASKGILLAALTNIAVKGGIAYWFGGKQFGRIVLSLFAVLIVIGVVFMIL